MTNEINSNEDRIFEFTKLAFIDARSEILSRLSMREKIVEVYLVSSISLLGALLIASRLIPELPVILYIVAPVLSLSMSLLIRSHYIAMEKLSEFIRYDLNDELIRIGAWSPYWDYFNRKENTGIGTSLDKTRARWRAHVISMHTPSAISMIFFCYSALNFSNKEPLTKLNFLSLDAFSFYIACIIYFSAIWCTFSNSSIRNDAKRNTVNTPKWHAKTSDKV